MNQAELQTSSEGYSIATVGDLASFEGKAFVNVSLSERRGQTCLTYAERKKRWSSERRAKPRLELCRVATEEDEVKRR